VSLSSFEYRTYPEPAEGGQVHFVEEVRPVSSHKPDLRITMKNWWVYIVEKKGKFYTGITTDLVNRMRQHGKSNHAYTEGPISRTNAVKRERQIKGWTRKKKLTLIKNASSQQL
jgi:putative endonuclease